jgi:hypothetical protein
VIIAHQVAAKATREALFFSSFPATSLPVMTIAAALFSIALVLLTCRAMTAVGPWRLVPGAFWASGLLHLAEWALVFRFKSAVAVAFYLHFAGLSAVLISGFWSMVNERFDPHTAKKRMGQIVGAGTLGALIGGLLAERIAAILTVPLMLPVLSAMHLSCGWILRMLRPPARSSRPPGDEPLAGRQPRPLTSEDGAAFSSAAVGGFRATARLLAGLPYLRHLALLVLLGAASRAMIDYVFKAQVQQAAAYAQEGLQRFYALFYAAVSLIAFLIHIAATRLLLEKSGLGTTVSTLPATVTLGSLGASLWPGLASAAVARGSENVVRSSLFQSGYELFYTPVLPAEKRSAKPLIDVGFDRLGDTLGSAIIRGLLWLIPGTAQPAMLGTAAGVGLLGIWIARRLDRGYVGVLEKSLRTRALELDLKHVEDKTTCATVMRTMVELDVGPRPRTERREDRPPAPLEPFPRRIIELRSGDPVRVRKALEEGTLSPALAAHVIPLLVRDEVAENAVRALRRAGPGITGQLIDVLLDSSEEFAVRRRIPKVLSAFASGTAADGLLLGLKDERFEVRFRCAKALAAILQKKPGLPLASDRVFVAVSRELELGKNLWENHRLLDDGEEDELLGGRATRGLEHVFTLLSLVLPKEPLRIAFQALQADDELLRGTALEYLASVLPPPIQEQLWPFLEAKRPAERALRSREETLSDLLRSHDSIEVRLAELRAKNTSQA